MDQSLFMPRQDDPDIILFVQLVADIDRTRSGITKDCVPRLYSSKDFSREA